MTAGRTLTTHCGSLARPHPLLETMREKEQARPYDRDRFEDQIATAVAESVRRQIDCGLDLVNDGEQGKASFFTYVVERLTGFSATEGEPVLPPSWKREIEAFPDYYRSYFGKYTETVVPLRVMACVGPVSYQGHDQLRRDIDNLRRAVSGGQAEGAFLTATSPRGFGRNVHYPSEQDYLVAVAEALREEYLTIVDAGFTLQIDDPWLIEILSGGPGSDPAANRRLAEEHIEIVNHALRGIPPEKVRLHTCYGLNAGPRIHDLPLAEIAPLMLRINAGAYSFEVANPRHYHEWKIWADLHLPEEKVLIPGFLGHATNYVEHPELIADGICNYASLVGRDRVVAGADCGFSSRATFSPEVDPEVVWEKFRALAEGARIASKRLWP
ncbi:MAG TPA: cobalamin-independent methionine synthase II family protein [Acidimicrobiia bacterium]|nr:cobalamin-independent methionine synthase II family protein [Acidimicrobiia bacterium]